MNKYELQIYNKELTEIIFYNEYIYFDDLTNDINKFLMKEKNINEFFKRIKVNTLNGCSKIWLFDSDSDDE